MSERSVKIGGNAVGNVIIPGNGNVVSVHVDTLSKTALNLPLDALQHHRDTELVGITSTEKCNWPGAVADELSVASIDLLSWPKTLPDGQWLERPEFSVIQERVEGTESSASVLLGPPGAGKSALLAALACHYVDLGWPVLAIKADALDPDIANEADLQARLGLSAPPSELIKRIAHVRPVLLVIDQLDALAGYLDIRTARLSILLNLVRQVGRLDNVHIVASARTFEFNHDTRLRSIDAEPVDLALPALSTVIELLEKKGVKASGWPPDAQEVIRTPQALSLYLKLDNRRKGEAFTTYQVMVEQLWRDRILVGNDGPRRAKLIEDIANHMAEDESLRLATVRFEDHRQDLQAIEAAGILIETDGGIGFTHQTLFDYALARNFARGAGRLSRYVLDRLDSLFLRPKLWTGLTYLRGVDPNAYHSEFEAIWNAPNLRKHLRFLLIDFLGQQGEPTDREALLMEQALQAPPDRWRAFQALSGSPGWFRRFSRSFVRQAMGSDDNAANRMIWVLSQAWPFAADDVADLIETAWLPDASHDDRVWATLERAPTWTERALKIAERVIARTDISASQVDGIIAMIGADQPGVAVRLLVASLNRMLTTAKAEARERRKLAPPAPDDYLKYFVWHARYSPTTTIKKVIEESREWDSLEALAEQSPRLFLDHVWPWYLTALDRLHEFDEHDGSGLGYPGAYLVNYRFAEEDETSLPEPAIPGALRTAIEHFAQQQPEVFLTWAIDQARLELAPVHQLLAHAFQSAPERFASHASDYLLADHRRFCLGTGLDMTSTTTRLIRAVSPHWDASQTAAFDDAVRRYNPPPRGDVDDPDARRARRNAVRRIKLDLLRSLPKNAMSAASRRHVQEEERRFGPPRPASGGSFFREIGSPMSAADMLKARDDDIVGAFEALPDATGWDHPRRRMAGGNLQLSREFATFAAQDPIRAQRIIARLAPDNGTRAAGYAIDALGKEADPSLVYDLLMDVVSRGFDGEEFRAATAHGIEGLISRKERIPDSILELFETWLREAAPETAGEDAEPEDEPEQDIDTATEDAPAETDRMDESLLWGYGSFAILPHGDYPVLRALTHARLERNESDRLIDTLSWYLGRNTEPAIWEHLLRSLPYIKPTVPDELASFIRKLFKAVPGLVGTREAAQYLANLHWQNLDLVEELLPVWRIGEKASTRMAYGEIVTLMAVLRPERPWPADRLSDILAKDALEAERVGAANSAVHLWIEDEYRGTANVILLRLLEIGPHDVWNAIFDLFRLVDDLSPDDQTVTLLTAIADHIGDAPKRDPTFVVEKLAALLPHQAPLVGRLSRALIEGWKEDLGGIRTSAAMAAVELVNVAVTLHRLGSETRELGTTLFELLLEIESYAARETLEELDSRFRDRPASPRRRLKRRSRKRPHRKPTSAHSGGDGGSTEAAEG